MDLVNPQCRPGALPRPQDDRRHPVQRADVARTSLPGCGAVRCGRPTSDTIRTSTFGRLTVKGQRRGAGTDRHRGAEDRPLNGRQAAPAAFEPLKAANGNRPRNSTRTDLPMRRQPDIGR
jgi:hypothetical protein